MLQESERGLFPADGFAPAPLSQADIPEKRRGRKPGARNKSTQEMLRYLRALPDHVDPLEVLSEIYSGTHELVERLSATDPDKALGRIIAAASVGVQYHHAKMPTEIKVRRYQRTVFTVTQSHEDDPDITDAISAQVIEADVLGEDVDPDAE